MGKFLYEFFISRIFFSFPIQLLIFNLKKNQILLLLWLFLILLVSEKVGNTVGLPYLFLEPEYINEVSFASFFILGVCLGIFTMSYHITCFLLDAPKFRFVACLPTPFIKFIINNSTLPAFFIAIYTYKVIEYQQASYAWQVVAMRVAGVIIGFNLSALLLLGYFVSTSQDIFRLLAQKIDKRLKRSKTLKVNVLSNLKTAQNEYLRVDYFINNFLILQKNNQNYTIDKATTLKIFKQNHFNAVIIQTFLFVLILLMGVLNQYTYFQLPAGASLVLLLTLILIITGALYFWLRGWTISIALVLLLFFNYAFTHHWIVSNYEAFGLNYKTEKAPYNLARLAKLTQPNMGEKDKKAMIQILENWKKKFPDSIKPKLFLLNVSGGGQRSAIWVMRTLQHVDSLTKGDFFKHITLITGASGGMVGAAYFREIYLQSLQNKEINPYHHQYWQNLGKDNLNAVAFSLIVNDIFLGFEKFRYGGYQYRKDRGYAFEEQLNKNTEGALDKPLAAYRKPEMLAQIPLLLLTPTILNDGRKLYISPQNTSFMTLPEPHFESHKIRGVEFLRFFEKQNAPNLRFLTALRMSATFPYVTPNIDLPSEPVMEIMDAGLSDNYGVGDAVRFVHIFKDWIEQNTSGVVFVGIRDTRKRTAITAKIDESLLARTFAPLGSLYANWEDTQDMNNDKLVEYAQSWLKVPVNRVDFQYLAYTQNGSSTTYQKRASLSWRLTHREKKSIYTSIFLKENQESIKNMRKYIDYF